jgi:hypothetical protein
MLCKIRMRAYLKSTDVWHTVESGWNCPNKAHAKLSRDEKSASSTNDKALNAIFTSISIK